MEITKERPPKAIASTGGQMHQLITELYPICRSITGEGVGQTLNIIKRDIPLTIHKIPTNTKVFDWEVPKEWNIKDAYIMNSRGEKIVDFAKSNLHVLNYSIPVDRSVTLRVLKEHLYTLPDHPDWIPYRTTYYEEDWGFCMAHSEFQKLTDDVYDVFIDSSLKDGYLTYGEYFIPGERPDEVLISTHICHPSLCNDNLSGIALAAQLTDLLRRLPLRYSYRFLFIPATLGSITWLSLNQQHTKGIKHGLVLAGVGDSGKTTYKKSRRGDAEIDKAARYVLRMSGEDYDVFDFVPYGYDE